MKDLFKIPLFFVAIIIITWSCNKSSELGSNLFEADKFDFQYAETLSLNAVAEQGPPILGYVSSDLTGLSSDNVMMVGKMEDPVYGVAEKKIYTQLVPVGAIGVGSPIIDSVVFRLYYDASSTYGDTTQTQKIGIYRLTEELTTPNFIYNNKTFTAESTPLGTATYKPTPRVITTVTAANDTATKINLKSRVDVKLDKSFGDLLFKDTSIYNDFSKFSAWFKGIEVRAESKTNTTTGFSFSSSDSTGLYVYYRTVVTDTISKVVSYIPTSTSIRYTYSNHDFNGSLVKPFLNNTEKSDSMLFVQSQSGVVTKLEIGGLKTLGNIIVNKAFLEFTVNPIESPLGFTPVDKILIMRPNFTPILDAATGNALLEVFGGTVIEKDGRQTYRMNISNHLQKVINGKESSYIYLVPENQQLKASRTVFYGTKHSKYPAKLLLYYTKLND
jgi:Domain of unknown function (DUF4270)